jgi:hypothetical protein
MAATSGESRIGNPCVPITTPATAATTAAEPRPAAKTRDGVRTMRDVRAGCSIQ